MNDVMKLLLIQLISKVGLELALQIVEIVTKAPTLADAVEALKKYENKTAQQYFDEAK